MYARLIYLAFFVLVLSLVGDVQAQDAIWTDGKVCGPGSVGECK